MNRLISILITLFVIFLVYIWINNVMSKQPDKTADVSNIEATSQSTDSETINSTKIVDEQKDSEDHSTDEVKTVDETKSTETKNETPPIAIPVNHKPAAPTPKVTKTSNQSQQKTTTPRKVKNAAQLHMVIAGNFSKRSNAENRLKELQQNGYKNAEIVNFDLSEYYTVCAGRFEELLEAKRIAKKVRDYLNIEAYVRVGKQ